MAHPPPDLVAVDPRFVTSVMAAQSRWMVHLEFGAMEKIQEPLPARVRSKETAHIGFDKISSTIANAASTACSEMRTVTVRATSSISYVTPIHVRPLPRSPFFQEIWKPHAAHKRSEPARSLFLSTLLPSYVKSTSSR